MPPTVAVAPTTTVISTRVVRSAHSAPPGMPRLRTGIITCKQPLIVRSGAELDSERVGSLRPGRKIYLLEIRDETAAAERPGGEGGGSVRALAAVDDNDEEEHLDRLRQPGLPLDNSWRDTYLSRPFWRDLDLQRMRMQWPELPGGWYGECDPTQTRLAQQGRPRSPRKLPVGWVTIAKEGRRNVTLTADLAAGVRQQHMQAWARRLAVDKTIDMVQKSLKQAHDVVSDGSTNPGGGKRAAGKQQLTKATISALKEKARGQNRERFANELLSDPTGVGFAYGGIHPGRLHARGKLIDVHRISYSIGLVGKYELHIGLRQQSLPLPGSPFQLVVVPGAASAVATKLPEGTVLPLTGTVGTASHQGCRLTLPTRDKMGNLCDTGGASVVCSCNNEEVEAETVDNENGTYSLIWRSQHSGTFTAQIAVDGEPIGGSPFKLQLVSDEPDLSRTEILGAGLSEARAGTPALVRLRLFDQYGNVAIGGAGLSFGITIVRVADKEDKGKWKRADTPSDPYAGQWDHDEFRIEYTPELAGQFDLYLWALDRKKRKPAASSSAAGGKGGAKEVEEEEGGAPEAAEGAKKKKKKPAGKGAKEAAAGGGGQQEGSTLLPAVRELLGDEPFRLNIAPGPADAVGCQIEGFSKGMETKADEKAPAGKPVLAPGQRPGAPAHGAGESVLPSGSPVGAGETIVFRPMVRDRWGNHVSAPESPLEMIVTLPPAGSNTASTEDDAPEGAPRETMRVPIEEQPRGDIVTFEGKFTPKVLGPYEVNLLLGGEPITGSPLVFEVLAGLPDVKTSRLVLPEPPLFSGENYELVLISVDKCVQPHSSVLACDPSNP